MTIKAIRTTYKGIEFRSRTEARWALFFDELGIPWEYEREGYELPSGWYVPDFWLPQQDCVWEVKGVRPTKQESALAGEVSAELGCEVFVAIGGPAEQENSESAILVESEGWNMPYRWAQCLVCLKWAPVYGGQYEWPVICNHGGVHEQTFSESAAARWERAIEATKRKSFWDPK